MSDNKHIDDVTGVETTGHEWDGIRELNNPLPRWWLWVWYASIVFSIGYWVLYPAWPYPGGYTKGLIGTTSRMEFIEDMKKAKALQAPYEQKLSQATLEQVRTDPELLEYAMAGGKSAFSVNCSQCHGSGAQGFKGFPNLNDDEWIWGGTLEDINFTITHGVRNETDDEAHSTDMPAFLQDEILTPSEIADVSEYVMSLSGTSTDAVSSKKGQVIFAEQCAACHQAAGEGSTDLGAPALNNTIWLYGGDKKTIMETVSNSRKGVMPAWGQKLNADVIKKLTIFIHSLGGGQ